MVESMIRAAQVVPGEQPFQSQWAGIGALLQERAAEASEADSLIAYDGDGVRWAYSRSALLQRVERTAAFLASRGVGRGDRVGTILHNHREAVFLMLAAWYLGAALVPVNVEESPARKRFILRDAGVCLLVALPPFLSEILPYREEFPALREVLAVDDPGAEGAAVLERLLPPAGAAAPQPAGTLADEALIVYTSGTTGNPKGVVLSQYNLLADADAIVRWFGIAPGERWMCVLPMHHVNGIVVTLLSPLVGGGATILNPRFSAQSFWPRAVAEGVAVCSLVPTLLEFLLSATPGGAPPGHRLRGVICGAGPLLGETALRFEERFGIPVWHGYGLSETTAYACMTPLSLPDAERRRWYREQGVPTIGTAMPHQEISIHASDGTALPPGERGEICIRGCTVMQGYYGRPDANAEAFRHSGWFRSGDEGFWLPGPGERPFFFITGRIKELIIRGGVNLSPLEIDAALAQHPAVRFGMAVPFENRFYGEEVAAYVVLEEGFARSEALAEEIRRAAAQQLPFSQQPKVVLFGEEVPYTTTGKPKRLALRELLAERLAPYRDVQYREGERHGG